MYKTNNSKKRKQDTEADLGLLQHPRRSTL